MNYKIITLFSVLITFWLGGYAYRHNKTNPVNQRFYYFMLILAFWIMTNFVVAMRPSAYLIQQTYSFGTLSTIFGFLWILWLIGKPLPKTKLRAAIIFSAIIIAVGAIPGTIVKRLISYDFISQNVDFGPAFNFLSVFNILMLISIVILLIRQYIISKGVKRARIKYILWGLGISCVIPMIGSFALPLFHIYDYTNYDAPSVVVFVVLASYAMSHYQLMSVQMFGKKIVTTFGLMLIGVACLSAVSYLFHYVFGVVFGAAFGVLVLAVTMSFIPAGDLRKFFNLTIIKDKYDYAIMINEFVAVVVNVLNAKELGEYTLEFLSRVVGIPNACIFLYRREKFVCVAMRQFLTVEIINSRKMLEALEQNEYIICDEFGEQQIDEIIKFSDFQPAVIFPIKNKGKVEGFFVLSRKAPDYDETDIKAISVIVNATMLNMESVTLRQQATTDGLTGLFIRRYFDLVFPKEIAWCKKRQLPISLLFCDIDNFKKYNDEFGHARGDEVLKSIAQAIKDNVRDDDVSCRYGGEELVVIVKETRRPSVDFEKYSVGVKSIGDRLCEVIRKKGFTVSIGICLTQQEYSAEKIIEVADKSMYQAKLQGKDRTVMAVI